MDPDELEDSTLAAMTRRDYKCKRCGDIYEDLYHISDPGHEHCPECGSLMSRYFGNTFGVHVNFGFRPARYLNKDDERIAQYQFENL